MASTTFSKMLANRGILVPHLDNYFGQWDLLPGELQFTISPHKEHDDAFHPSSAIGCARYIYAAKMKHLAPRDAANKAASNKTFLFGHFFHSLVQMVIVDRLKFATWDDVEKEYALESVTEKGNRYWARGFSDIARVNIPGQSEPVLVDIKTMMARQFALKELPFGLMEKYNAQVQLYLDWEDLDTGIILCCEKDNPHRFKEVVIKRDPFVINAIYDHWELVADALAESTPPPCTCEPGERCPAGELYD